MNLHPKYGRLDNIKNPRDTHVSLDFNLFKGGNVMNFDNGKISTIIISIAGAILAAMIADPTLLQTLMGSYYIQYGAVILTVLIIIYNALYPRELDTNTQELQYNT